MHKIKDITNTITALVQYLGIHIFFNCSGLGNRNASNSHAYWLNTGSYALTSNKL